MAYSLTYAQPPPKDILENRVIDVLSSQQNESVAYDSGQVMIAGQHGVSIKVALEGFHINLISRAVLCLQ